MEYIELIVKYIGYAGVIGGAIVTVWRAILEYHKIREGMRCQLRSEMLSIYHRHRETKRLRQYEAENFGMMYKAYKALGGNSFIDEIHDHVRKWDVET